jgi:hypothetical protein
MKYEYEYEYYNVQMCEEHFSKQQKLTSLYPTFHFLLQKLYILYKKKTKKTKKKVLPKKWFHQH